MHKTNALCGGACEQQDPVADHPVAQQDGRVIEKHEIDEVAANGTGRSSNYAEERVGHGGRACDVSVVDEDGDVDVTVRAVPATGPAAEQPGEADDRIGAQAAREIFAQPAGRGVAHWFEPGHRDSNVPDADAGKNAWRTGAGWSTIVG